MPTHTPDAQRIALGQKLAKGEITRAEYDRRFDAIDRAQYGKPKRDGRIKEKRTHA